MRLIRGALHFLGGCAIVMGTAGSVHAVSGDPKFPPNVRHSVHRGDPYAHSREADAQARVEHEGNPERTAYFAEREVLAADGSYPMGEGFLYRSTKGGPSTPVLAAPQGVGSAGNRGAKSVQQDAMGHRRIRMGTREAVALVAADGVSASRALAAPASRVAVDTFLNQLQTELAVVTADDEATRHAQVEAAMVKAAARANFEVVRQVLFDLDGSGSYDAPDAAKFKAAGVDLPDGPLNDADMERLAPALDWGIQQLRGQNVSAQTTFSVAVAVENDLYTFNAGDSVVNLYRPSEPEGERLLQLTERDQAVVAIYREGGDVYRNYPGVFQNRITDSFGDAGQLTGTVRRYPDVLRPGDRVLAATDGIGPRGNGNRGLQRRDIEGILSRVEDPAQAARALVNAQMAGLGADEYQDNIAAVVLNVGRP